MAEDPEKRFERAMNLLFSSSKGSTSVSRPGPAQTSGLVSSLVRDDTSLPSPSPSPAILKQTKALMYGTTPSSRSSPSALAPSPAGNDCLQPVCRPWDRRDFLRRLATFKSITWFGRPLVAGPIACARRGWVNVEVDLLACEGCGARLSLVLPDSWSRAQVDSAAEAFGEKLDSGHKPLCPWKGNACSDALALFPPTPPDAVVSGFHDRCERLLQLSALPVISGNAIDTLKLLNGSQIESLLAQPPPLPSGFPYKGERVTGEESGERSENGYSYNGFYQAQRLISLCGWEPRLLPYTVDPDDVSGPPAKNSQTGSLVDAVDSKRWRDSGPSVFLVSEEEKQEEKSETSPRTWKKRDASAVLDCSLCGASVGLWGFSTIPQPPASLGAVLAAHPDPPKKRGNGDEGGPNAVCGDSTRDHHVKGAAEIREKDGEATKTPPRGRSSTVPGRLNLSLTIAGGPSPTQMGSFAMMPSAFGPIPGFLPRLRQPVFSEVGNSVGSNEGRGPRDHDQASELCGSTLERSVAADSAEGAIDHVMEDREIGHTSGSFKRRQRTGSPVVNRVSQGAALSADVTNAGTQMDAEMQATGQKRRKTDAAGTSTSQSISEKSSIQNLGIVSDGQSVREKQSSIHDEGNETVTRILQGEAGVGTGGGNVAWKSEIRHNVSEFSINPDVGAAVVGDATENDRATGHFVRDKGFVVESLPDGEGKTGPNDGLGRSNEVVQAQPASQRSGNPQGETQESRGRRIYEEGGDQTEDEGTVDTTRAVILSGESSQEAAATDGDTKDAGGGEDDHGCTTVNGPRRVLDEFRIFDTNAGEFDPIRQHRHFCPWVNSNVAAASNSSVPVCGWQLTLDALYRYHHHQHHHDSTRGAELESPASIFKESPLASVRKLMGTSPSERSKGSKLLAS